MGEKERGGGRVGERERGWEREEGEGGSDRDLRLTKRNETLLTSVYCTLGLEKRTT